MVIPCWLFREFGGRAESASKVKTSASQRGGAGSLHRPGTKSDPELKSRSDSQQTFVSPIVVAPLADVRWLT